MNENDKSMEEYKGFRELLNNQKEDYNFIDKLGYDDWNKKEAIRNYIKQIRKQNKEKQDIIDKIKEYIKNNEYFDYDCNSYQLLNYENILQIIEGEDK